MPELRIVIDHLPTLVIPSEPAARDEYWALLRHLAQNKNIFVKLSESEAAHNESVLDSLWNIFGEDQVLYASDWPNSEHHATYLKTITTVRDFVATKSRGAKEKFFWRNSVSAYRWHRRKADQPVLG